jgi:DNA-binding transcriptional MerR regulator
LRGRYTSSDIIKELKISKVTLFAWEKAGKIPKARRDPMAGYRVWTREEIEKIKKIINKGLK